MKLKETCLSEIYLKHEINRKNVVGSEPFSSAFNDRFSDYSEWMLWLFIYHFAPNVYIREMIDDCFDALKSINTMERVVGALASLFQQIRT